MPPDIFTYLNPEDVVKITLEGIDKDLRFMDLIFLFISILSAYLTLSYITVRKPKFYFNGRKSNDLSDKKDSFELDIFGLKVNRRQIFHIAILTTIVHLSLGLMLRSKTNLIIEISNACTLERARLEGNYAERRDTTGLYAAKTSELLIKHYIAENYAFQSLSNSILFQTFNYRKMYITRKEEEVSILKMFDYLILSIPFLLFTFFFFLVGFEWLARIDSAFRRTNSLYDKKPFRVTLLLFVYSMNIYSFYLWIYGVRDVARLVDFRYKLG